MDVSGAASLSVEEAMKILNMKQFDAEELNEKFRYRIASTARGLGGTLETQRKTYTAWEYLNRMLARQASRNSEEILRKADKTWNVVENPKLDMMPSRPSGSGKVSVIIEKKNQSERHDKTVFGKHGINRTPSKVHSPNAIDHLHKAPYVHLPKLVKSSKWREFSVTYSSAKERQKESKSVANQRKIKETLAKSTIGSERSEIERRQEDSTITQLREIADISKKSHSRTVMTDEDMEKLSRIFEKLPKPSRTASSNSIFKTTTILNDIFDNPKRPSRFDQRLSARRIQWKERAKRLVIDENSGNVTEKRQSKTKKTRRRFSKKQQQVLYKEAEPCIDQLDRSGRISKVTPSPTAPLQHPPSGLYTPTRIMNWIEFSK